MPELAIDGRDWTTVEPHVHALLAEPLAAGGVPGWLRRWSDLEKHLYETEARLQRARSENTLDEAAERAYLDFVEHVQPHWRVATNDLKTKLLAVEGYEPGPDEAQMLRRFRAEADLFRPENVELLSRIAVLATEYDKLVGAMTVRLDGRDLTVQEANARLLEPDRDLRERAWRASQDEYLKVREPLDELYLKLLALRRQVARNAGLPGYREYAWREYGRFDYTPEDCATFHDAIEATVVPIVERLNEARRARLGVDSLRPWDLEVDPDSRPALRPFSEVAQLEAAGARVFGRVDPDLGEQFGRLRHGQLDLASRKGKAPGAYCESFPVLRLPYIFQNAVGTHGDVQTLLHEAGHAFHDLHSLEAHELFWNAGAPMEFCEVASMSMELLASPYLERERGGLYSAEEAARARAEKLEGDLRFLPYMAVVDAFQHWVYAEAPVDVTAAQLDARWDELWRRFMTGTDWTGLEVERATGWHRKLHLFHRPFYYVEYGLAQVGALQVWRNALDDQAKAVRQYRAALSLGNTRPLPVLFETAGARFAFDRRTVGDLVDLAARHLEAAYRGSS